MPDYASSGPPQINLHQATPQGGAYASGANIPGALHPAASSRPTQYSTNPAIASVPAALQIQTQTQPPYMPSTRPANNNPSHSYSRSSPSGLESPKYVPYPGTPETTRYPFPSNQKYIPAQSRQGAISNSPLGLADIRPRAGSGVSDGPMSANPWSFEDDLFHPTSCSYHATWPIYAFDWCKWSTHPQHANGGAGGAGKVAIGSYLEDGHNYIQVLDTEVSRGSSADLTSPASHSYRIDFVKLAEATHTYPVTRILWEPPASQKQSTDLLATSGDHLRLWSLPSNATTSQSNTIGRSSTHRDPAPYKLTPLALLSNSKTPEHTAPLTSLDWNTLMPSLIITSSIDTTCTIWDIPTLTAKTQLIAHDREVFDVRFCANSVDVFVSCGADGSVRMFDLRSLEHSTIIYEPMDKTEKGANAGNVSPTTAQQTMSYAPPLLRLSASPHDSHLLATFSQDSSIIRILDVRQPGQALLELQGHAGSINCIEWSPSRRGMLASGADDCQVLIWDLVSLSTAPLTIPSLNGGSAGQLAGSGGGTGSGGGGGGGGGNPLAAWRCEREVNNISWAPSSRLAGQGGDWIGVSGGRGISGVKF